MGTAPLRISVLTACRNSAKTIRHTLDSFFEQDYPDREIVVVDALSKDETLDIVRSYPQDGMIVVSEADRGMYDGLNKALALCTGDAVGVLNSDDAYHDRSVLGRIAETLAAADIVTIEGLPEAEKEPLVAAWVEEDVPQCGSRWRSVSEAAVARLDGAQALSFCVTGTPR